MVYFQYNINWQSIKKKFMNNMLIFCEAKINYNIIYKCINKITYITIKFFKYKLIYIFHFQQKFLNFKQYNSFHQNHIFLQIKNKIDVAINK